MMNEKGYEQMLHDTERGMITSLSTQHKKLDI